MFKIHLVVFVIAIILQPFASHGCYLELREDNWVRIVNLLPKNSKPLRLHCAAGDDDLGFHNIIVGQEFKWNFCPNIFGTTLYFCHFWWDTKQIAFDVYKSEDPNITKSFNVFAMKSDGIYLAHDNSESSLKKYISWR